MQSFETPIILKRLPEKFQVALVTFIISLLSTYFKRDKKRKPFDFLFYRLNQLINIKPEPLWLFQPIVRMQLYQIQPDPPILYGQPQSQHVSDRS